MRRREWLVLAAAVSPGLRGGAARAFRGWFCWLAEIVYHLPSERRPKEVKDCSSLARFAYREALRKHDGRWLAQWGFPAPPPLAEVPQGVAPLFETGDEGPRHFADAANLMRHNSYFVAKRTEAALPGDLLFFRQAQMAGAFHMMVYLGASLCTGEAEPCVVYHTGPEGADPGEMRRPALDELMRHPEARWRPVASNPAFQGVFRWNVLRGGQG